MGMSSCCYNSSVCAYFLAHDECRHLESIFPPSRELWECRVVAIIRVSPSGTVLSVASEFHSLAISVLQCVAVCCSVSQCVAVYRSVLQCVAVCCSVCFYINWEGGGRARESE